MTFRNFLAILSISICFVSGFAFSQSRSQGAQKAFGDSEFRLGPDDLIQVFVWQDERLSTDVVVRPDGKISLPLVGELIASGKTSVELQNEIGERLTPFFETGLVVNVIVKEVNSAKISVLGEVKNPGVYKIKDRATVIDAIADAGGFTEYAKRDNVVVIRVASNGEPRRIKLNVDDLIKKSKGEMFYVLPYDKIYVQ
ncbi:MAG: polysaccharide biosynthesis/export family protein [Acidobacteria bacterium]|nr:polysaccharide biosynthesis/export family protein [Acidobacteriota bacterium]